MGKSPGGPLTPAVEQAHVRPSEIELREFVGDPFEAYHEFRRELLLLDSVDAIERALAKPNPFFPHLPQVFERRRLGIGLQ
jgi:hypothetical protein